MFSSEREMQDLFVILLKKKKTCGLIFEEVGNRNFFFRTDVVEYKNRNEIIGYELKLKYFNKLIEQSLFTLNLFDKSYMVIPLEMKNHFLKILNEYPNKNKDKIGVIVVSDEKYRVIKAPEKASTRNYKEKWHCTLIPDLIIRGYHKDGVNRCKSYK